MTSAARPNPKKMVPSSAAASPRNFPSSTSSSRTGCAEEGEQGPVLALPGHAQRTHQEPHERDDDDDQIEQAGRGPPETGAPDGAEGRHAQQGQGQRQPREHDGQQQEPPAPPCVLQLLAHHETHA